MSACGVLPPMAETISWRRLASRRSRAPTPPASAGIDGVPAERRHDPDAVGPAEQRAPGRRRPPAAAPSQSSAAARSAAVISSSGSGRSRRRRGRRRAGVVTWPTPTTTGVRGSRAMDASSVPAARPSRRLPGASVDSVLHACRRRLGSRRVRPQGDPQGRAGRARPRGRSTSARQRRGTSVDYPDYGAAVGRAVARRPGRAGRLRLRHRHRHRHGGQQGPRRPGGRGPRRHDGRAGPRAQPRQRHLLRRPRPLGRDRRHRRAARLPRCARATEQRSSRRAASRSWPPSTASPAST